MDTFIIFYIIFPISVLCFKDQLHTGECGYTCCAHYYREDGKCIECKLGYYRFGEDNDRYCRPCEVGFYGKRCKKTCKCSNNERCDKVEGCVCKATISRGTNCTRQESKSITADGSRLNVSTKYDTTVTSKNLNQQLLIFGLPCGVSLALIVTVVCFIKQKIMCTIHWRVHREANTTNTSDLNDGYDIIDENSIAVNDHTTQGSHQPISVKSDQSDDIILRNSDNYLQPIPETDLLSNGSDDSVRNNIPVCNSNDYLHPYNSLRPNWTNHTHVYNDEEQEIQNDGYLNPYQPLQENWLKNSHVYNITEKQISLHGKLEGDINPDPSGQKPQKESKI